jgi:hypothetical protein
LVIAGWAGFAAAVGLSAWVVHVLDDNPFPLPTTTSKVAVIAVVGGTVALVSVGVIAAGAFLRTRSNGAPSARRIDSPVGS